MDLAEGTRVTDNLTLTRKLGEGGMGCVWVAQNHALETEVAIKFISSEEARADEALVARFKREAKAAAQIKSPHVVQMFNHGVTADGMPYIVMELMEGESLLERLDRAGMMAPADVAEVIDQTTNVLVKAHGLGIVHRDLKPDNLFLVSGGRGLFVKVLDFGLAKLSQAAQISVVTATNVVAGTPHYMSPEQLLSTKNVDGRTDLWALAVVAYRALTAKLPFAGETIPELTLNVFQGKFAPPSSIRADLVHPLDAWFARAFHSEIEQRFQSADEFAAAFRSAVSQAPVFGVATAATTVAAAASAVPSAEISSAGVVSSPMVAGFGAGGPGSGNTFEGAARSPASPKPSRTLPMVLAGAMVIAVGGAVFWWRTHVAEQSEMASQAAMTQEMAPSSPAATGARSSSTVDESHAAVAAAPSPSASSSVAPSATVPTTQPTRRSAPPKTTSPPPAAKVDCTVSHYIGADGLEHPKPECL